MGDHPGPDRFERRSASQRIFRPGVATYELWLKLGIVLVGARFLLQDVLHIGGLSLALVAVELILSLSVMTLLGRIFRLPPKLTSLLAIGSSICGVTAIMAAQGAIEPDEEDTSTAIAAILTLGAIALFTFPAIGHSLHMGQQAYGMWAGLAVDNTAESVVTGALYGEEAGRWAMLAKTARSSFIGFVVLGYAVYWASQGPGGSSRRTSRCFCGRSFPSSSSASSPSRCSRRRASSRKGQLTSLSNLSRWAFLPAFAGVGLRTNLKDLVGQGWRPLVVGILGEIFIALLTLGARLLELQPRSGPMTPVRCAMSRCVALLSLLLSPPSENTRHRIASVTIQFLNARVNLRAPTTLQETRMISHAIRRTPSLLLRPLLALVSCTHDSCSAQVVGGTISGTVTDPSGAAIAERRRCSSITMRPATSAVCTTGPDGRYAAPSVPVGSYTRSVSRRWLRRSDGGSDIPALGRAVAEREPHSLRRRGRAVGNSGGQPPVVNLSTQQTSGLVDARQVKELPLNGRSYDQLITLNPGDGELHGAAVGLGGHVELVRRQHVRRLRPPPAGQSVSAERRRVHGRVADQRHARRNLGPTARRGGGPRVQRDHRHLLGRLRQARRARRSRSSPPAAPTMCTARRTSSCATPSSTRATTSTRRAFPSSSATTSARRSAARSSKDKLFLFANYEGYRQNLGVTDVTLVPDNNARQGWLPNANGVLQPVTLGSGVAGLLNLWPVQNGPELLTATGQPTGIARGVLVARRSTSAKTSAPRASTHNLTPERPAVRGLHHRRFDRQHAHAESRYSLVNETPARAGRQRAGAARLLAAPAEHRARWASRAPASTSLVRCPRRSRRSRRPSCRASRRVPS